MDPLSVTLAVVTLATAVKDMVELGQKIHESFAKVSRNLRKAQCIAERINGMVEEIKVFCEDHKDVLADTKDFLLALQGLLGKFRNFEASILPLLPKTRRRKLGDLVRGWWNNNKIQESLLELESDIVQVMWRFMTTSTMRIEVKQESNHQETSRGLTGIAQGLEVVRRDVSALCTTTATITTMTHRSHESSDEFTRNVLAFAQSTPSSSTPMLRTPNVITEELMTAAYIKLQINNIAMTVEKMTISRVAHNSVPPFQLSLILEHRVMNIMHLRHHVVRQVTDIRDLLETEHIHNMSIYDGATALNHLSAGLRALGMNQESIAVAKWAITLVRLLVNASDRQPALISALALHLLNQSINYYNSGDWGDSLQAIKEAYAIAQNLQNQYGQYGGEASPQELHSNILLQYAKLVDNQKSIEMCIRAVQVLEDILNVQAYAQLPLPKRIAYNSSSFVDNLFSLALPITAITSYAAALQQLGISLTIDGHPESALDLVRLAIAVRQKMVPIHGHEYEGDLAFALSQVVQGLYRDHIPAEELLDMADECILLLRELVEKNPPYYARELVDVLWEKAEALARLDRDTEAISIWEEIVSLAQQVVQDSELCAASLGKLSNHFRRLQRHDDAVRTGRLAITTYHREAEIRAARYLNLSLDLQELRHYEESAEAARTSVTLYRRLVTQKVQGLVEPFITISQDCFDEMIESMVREARLRANRGDSEEAIQVAERALPLSRNNELESSINSLVWSLYGIALTMLSFQNYDRAVETAREGCYILASPYGLEFPDGREYHSCIRPSLIAILSSAEANLGRYSTALEYAHHGVGASLEIKEMKAYVLATTAERSYMETRGNLAEILLATGDLAQARQICQERSAYFSKRVEKRMGDYRELAPILRMLGILCCSEGNHEEGEATAQELSRIMKTLGSAFPSLQEEVKNRLRKQAKVPILKVLDDMSQKLDCGHQSEIVSLFTV